VKPTCIFFLFSDVFHTKNRLKHTQHHIPSHTYTRIIFRLRIISLKTEKNKLLTVAYWQTEFKLGPNGPTS